MRILRYDEVLVSLETDELVKGMMCRVTPTLDKKYGHS